MAMGPMLARRSCNLRFYPNGVWRGAKDLGLQAWDAEPLPDYFRPAQFNYKYLQC